MEYKSSSEYIEDIFEDGQRDNIIVIRPYSRVKVGWDGGKLLMYQTTFFNLG